MDGGQARSSARSHHSEWCALRVSGRSETGDAAASAGVALSPAPLAGAGSLLAATSRRRQVLVDHRDCRSGRDRCRAGESNTATAADLAGNCFRRSDRNIQPHDRRGGTPERNCVWLEPPTFSGIRILTLDSNTIGDLLPIRQWVVMTKLGVREQASGTSIRGRPCVSKVGNRHIRHVLYLAAIATVRGPNAYRAYYQRRFERDKK